MSSRLLFAAALAGLLAADLEGTAHAAPSPSHVTITPSSGAQVYTSGPITGTNVTGAAGTDPICTPGTCDDETLTVSIPDSYRLANPDDIITITETWPNSSNDFDLYLLNSAGTRVSAAATSNDPEVIRLPIGALPDGDYIVRMVAFSVTAETYAGRISLDPAPPPPPPAAGTQTGVYQTGVDIFSCNQHVKGEGHDGDGEPGVKIDKNGQVFVTSNAGTPAGIGLWKITDPCGQLFTFLGSPDPGGLGGGDCDVEAAQVKNANNQYNIYTSSLYLANITSCTSKDGGATFNCTVLSDQTPVNDRQWNATYGANTLYLSFRAANTGNQLIVYRSDMAGDPLTFVGPFLVYSDVVVDATLNTQLGCMVADQRPGANFSNPAAPVAGPNGEGNVYHGFMTLTTDQNRIYVAVSKDFGVTWASKLVFQGGAGDNFRYDFSWVAVDPAGNVYTAFSDQHNIYYAVSSDQGEHWSAPFRVSNGADNKAAIFPAMDVGSPGHLVFTWYGTSSSLGTTNPLARYHVFHSRCDNALAALTGGLPVFKQVRVSDHVMHTGIVCLSGTTCMGGRQLLEDFEIGIDPTTGGSFITYTDDGAEGGTYISREIAGESAILGKSVADHSSDCPRNLDGCSLKAPGNPCELPGVQVVSDPTGDESPSDEQRDIEAIAIAEPATPLGMDRLVFSMKVHRLDANPLLLPQDAAWRMFFSYGGTDWFVRMLNCPTGVSFDYGTVGTTSTTIGPADGGTYSPATGTIAITLLKSRVGSPPPNSILTGIGGMTRIHGGPCPPPPGPAGVGQNLDDTGTSSYTLAGPNYCQVTATLVERFEASAVAGAAVEVVWTANQVSEVRGWNLYRGTEPDALDRVNAAPIAVRGGGTFRYRDVPDLTGLVHYRLTALMADGSEQVMALTSVLVRGQAGSFWFGMNGANPFSGQTSFEYSLPAAAPVRIDVFSVTGRRVRTLVDRVESAGIHGVSFGLRTEGARVLPPGIYLVKISAGAMRQSLRVVAIE